MLTRSKRNRWLCLAALASLAPLQVLAVADDDTAVAGPGQLLADPPPLAVLAPRATTPAPAPRPADPVTAMAAPAGDAVPDLVTEPAAAPSSEPPAAPDAAAPPGPATFADRFPAQVAARQDPADPASTRWALLIGINEHLGSVADNIGSRQDAEDLRAQLLARGWRDENILLLTDRQATGANIVDGIAWLAERTDQDSVAVFHYSGHSKKWRGDVDGDGEWLDEGLWPTDDRFIVDSELVRLLDPVRPQALWLSFATCNAAGLADAGLARPGRILTFSSGESQKSYEHPSWGNSVWGWLMLEQGIGAGLGDLDGDGRVTVEEAFAWARPRATETTRGQRYGSQDGVIVDQVEGDFDLLVPGAPPPPRRAATEPPPEQQPDAPEPAPAPERREPSEDHHGNRICLLCGR